MTVLGIETATQICGAAIVRDDDLLAEYRLNIKNVHARLIMGAIEKLMNDCDISFDVLDGTAVSIGPGSFTGLRIGLSVAKSLAFSRRIPIVAVPTLEALAAQAPVANGIICPFIRARMGEVYTALYERENFRDNLIEDVSIVALNGFADRIPKGAYAIGETALIESVNLSRSQIQSAPAGFEHLSAFTVGRIGAVKLARGETEDVDVIEPRYFQDFIAGKPKKPIIVEDDR